MNAYTRQIINPESNRAIVVGGKTYKELLKTGKIPFREIHIFDGVKQVDMNSGSNLVSNTRQAKFKSDEEKINGLKAYRAQKDANKKAKKKKLDETDEVEILRRKLKAQKLKTHKLKSSQQVKREVKEEVKKKDDDFEYSSDSDSLSSS